MDKYLIFLKPEFENDNLSAELFIDFFVKKGFQIIRESNYKDSQNVTVIKNGVLVAQKGDISIKFLLSQNSLIAFYDSYILDLLKEFSQVIDITTFIHGENDEEY